jgi:thiol-disulfide isomerase/thioredoxin
LLAYALGSAVTLGVVRWLVGRAGRRLPVGLLGALPWAGAVRRAGGAFVLLTVALVGTGWDTRLAATLPGLGLEQIEQSWLDRWSPSAPDPAAPAVKSPTGPLALAPAARWPEAPAAGIQRVAAAVPSALPVLGQMPSLAGATDWLQSMPLGPSELRGKVVLVDFWTFGCVNCRRALPAVRRWAERYRADGLVVIGVHSPEFAFERARANVERALRRLDLKFPIAVDNDFAVWNAWSNRYWPTLYLIDAQGRVRWRHIGEGAYAETEQAIQYLLDEARQLRPAS